MLEQSNVADKTRDFLQCWGLKGKFVAATCYIPERIFSRFLNHKTALTSNQLKRLESYMDDYERRNR